MTDIVLVIPSVSDEKESIESEQAHIRRLFVDPLPPAAAVKVRAFVPGGTERYNSIYNGIEAIAWPCDYVFIYDGARPLITEEMLETLLAAVQQYKAVVAACPSKDTVKITDDSGFVASTPDRSYVWNIQTPQCFEYSLVKDAYEKVIGKAASAETTDTVNAVDAAAVPARKTDSTFLSEAKIGFCSREKHPAPLKITDDAMVVEYASETKVRPVDTGYRNIKITTPEDLLIAEALLRSRTDRTDRT